MAGDIKVVLYVSSDAPDTDFFVKLIDMHPPSADYPNGFALQLTDGVLRARDRKGFAAPTLLKSGQVYRLEIPLEPTANRSQAHHRIRLDISSSNFPGYDINHNTADPNERSWRGTNNTIWHARQHPSCVVLPLFSAP